MQHSFQEHENSELCVSEQPDHSGLFSWHFKVTF